MKLNGKILFSILILTLIISLSSANAQRLVPENEKFGGTLKIAISKDFKSLDARYLSKSGSATRGQQQLYNRMVEYGPGGTQDIVPALATNWEQIDDVTWLVHIRKGVKFHNGKELTAADVAQNFDYKFNSRKYSNEKGWRPPRGRSDTIQVKNVEAVAKYTLKYTLKFPFGPFVPMNLAWSLRGVIDPDVVTKHGNRATRHPIGTGPFKFVKYVSGSHLILQRFEDYWGGKPYLDRILIRIIPDVQTRLIALQKGEVDIATDLLYSQTAELEKDPNLNYYLINDARRGSWGNLWFNLRRWPMNQLKFRTAISMGADWAYIGKAVFPKGITPSPIRYTFFEGSWLENEKAKKLVPQYNPRKSRQLLKEIEKEAGKPLPRIYAMTNRGHQGIPGNAFRIAAEQLKKVGLKIDLNVLEEEVSKDKFRRDPKCAWDIMIAGYKSPGIDPSETVSDFYSKTVTAGDGQNISAYNNPKVDELILKGGALYDKEKRKKVYQEIESILLRDLVVLPLFNIQYIRGVNKRVHDFPDHDSVHPLFFTSWNNVWLEKEK